MNRGFGSRDTITLAGWLFADLLLGLALLFFVADSKGVAPAPTPTITPIPTRTRTPTNTLTPTDTLTPTPTVTRYPTYTPYPTFTPNLTYTPYPSLTPYPPNTTYTPYPTFTPVPPEFTYTPYPTYTQPAPAATYTPFPTVIFGLNGTPFTANLKVNRDTINALVSGSAADQANARAQIQAQLSPQIRTCFNRFDGLARAGVALVFGTNPSPTIGNTIAKEADNVLRQEYPNIFDTTVSKQYHFISADESQDGDITVEVYFISASGESDPFTVDNGTCNP